METYTIPVYAVSLQEPLQGASALRTWVEQSCYLWIVRSFGKVEKVRYCVTHYPARTEAPSFKYLPGYPRHKYDEMSPPNWRPLGLLS